MISYLFTRQLDVLVRQVCDEGGHASRFKIMESNAWDRSAWGQRSDSTCFVVATEVLDNLPHDKVVRGAAEEPWQQVI